MKIGIDLGGTKIEIITLNDSGKEFYRKRVATPKDSYQTILNTISELVFDTETRFNSKGSVGICTPGAISPKTDLLRNSSTSSLNNKPFKQDLENRLNRKIAIANDANCFALSESVDGAGQDSSIIFGVIVGTGTGAGIVIDRQVLVGSNSIAGEWGHNPLPWPNTNELPGMDCYCGKKGCIETWLSGPGLSKNHHLASQQLLDPTQIVLQAEKGCTICEDSLIKYEDRMARGLSHIINIIDPDVIILGGGMSNISRLYNNIPKIWHKYIFSDHINTQLRPPFHGDSSGVRGAAWLGS